MISTLWKKLLAITEAKQAVKTGLAASISLVLGLAFATYYDRPDTMVSGLWSVMTAIVVMQANIGGTYGAAWIRFLGVLVGSIAGGLFINLIGSDTVSLGISVFCTIVICSLLNIKDSFRIAGLSTAVIIISDSQHPEINPWLFSLYRFLDSCIGIFVALAISRFLWPAKAIEEIRANVAKLLNLFGKYYLLSTSLEPAGAATEAEFFEIDALLQENRIKRNAAELEFFDRSANGESWVLLSDQLETIFEAVNSIRQVHKETLSKIFDDSLFRSVSAVIDQTHSAFDSMERAIRCDETSPPFPKLESALAVMAGERLRFRATHTIRKFNLEDVESFFVYFYGLRLIGESILKMSRETLEGD